MKLHSDHASSSLTSTQALCREIGHAFRIRSISLVIAKLWNHTYNGLRKQCPRKLARLCGNIPVLVYCPCSNSSAHLPHFLHESGWAESWLLCWLVKPVSTHDHALISAVSLCRPSSFRRLPILSLRSENDVRLLEFSLLVVARVIHFWALYHFSLWKFQSS